MCGYVDDAFHGIGIDPVHDVHQRIADRVLTAFHFAAQATAHIALTVHVDQQDPLTHTGKTRAKVDCCGRLADATLLVNDCCYFTHFLCLSSKMISRFLLRPPSSRMSSRTPASRPGRPML